VLTQRITPILYFTMLCLCCVGCSEAADGDVLEFDPILESDHGGGNGMHSADFRREGPVQDSSLAQGEQDLDSPADMAFEQADVDPIVNAPDAGLDVAKTCRENVDEGGVYGFSALSLTSGMDVAMCEYAGDALLIVNTAANCGFTPQYTGLEGLHRRYINRPLTILGFLSDDFGDQGGSLAEVEECNERYMITFEQFYHVGVTSTSRDGQHPLFEWLTNQPEYGGEIPWNFSKFLVSHDGRLLGRWDNLTTPDDPTFQAAVESAVGRAELWQR